MLTSNIFFSIFINALTTRNDIAPFYSRLAILALLATSYITFQNVFAIILEKGISLYGGLYNLSTLIQSFTLFVLLLSGVILIYNSFYPRIIIVNRITSVKDILKRKSHSTLINQEDNNLQIYKILEYPLIIMFIITGATFLMSSADLISLFIAIELQSYGLYILCTLHRDSEQATWGGLTYFLLGGLSSCFILLGSALLYINSGTTSLEALYIISAISDIIPDSLTQADNLIQSISYTQDTYYINLSLIIMTVGFLFKVSAAPFHFWSPDVYDAIPTTVTTYVALIAKISIFIFLLELVYYINNDMSAYSWKNCLLVSSLFSLLIGSILGLTQYRIKRLYAYSTISHVGFILLALTINTPESIQAYLFYILSYTISNLNAFVILVTIGYQMYFYINSKHKEKSLSTLVKTQDEDKSHRNMNLHLNNVEENKFNVISNNKQLEKSSNHLENLKEKHNSPIQLVNQLKGFFYINSYLALSLAITLFSFIGITPLVGFFAKQMVLSAALDSGYLFITLIGILTSVIGVAYYLNIVKHMFFFKSDYIINPLLSQYKYFGLQASPKSDEVNETNDHANKTNDHADNTSNKSESNKKELPNQNIIFMRSDIKLSSALSITISVLTLLLLLFIFIPNESFNLAKILTLLLFN